MSDKGVLSDYSYELEVNCLRLLPLKNSEVFRFWVRRPASV